jgi:site-specific DNA-methyltransferase (adenine-specific)
MSPYYADETVTLYHGRFEEILPDLGITADLIVTDPPYGETSLTWDRWPTGWPAIAAQYGRSMWCFGSMRMFLDQRHEFADWRLSQDVVWEKHNGSGFAADRFKRVHEFALHWYRGEWSTIHHETPVTHDATARVVKRRGRTEHTGRIGAETDYATVDGGPRLARSVIYARNMNGSAINETEKPTGVVEPLIAYGCPPGGLVVDLFAGSCSTLVSARNLGRRAVGFEMREDQCEKAARRLSQGVLFSDGAA